MELEQPLREGTVEVEQPLDYEGVPFRCIRFHIYGHFQNLDTSVWLVFLLGWIRKTVLREGTVKVEQPLYYGGVPF